MEPHTIPVTSEPVATSTDTSRPTPTQDDSFISLDEARVLFTEHGRDITDRSLQRSCKNGHFACKKILTETGDKWFADRQSVVRRINELDEFDRLRAQRQDTTRPDTSAVVVPEKQHISDDTAPRPDATPDVSEPNVAPETSHPTQPDEPRHVDPSRDVSEPVATDFSERERQMYEERIAELKDALEERTGEFKAMLDDVRKDKADLSEDKAKLYEQLSTKDSQIERFFSSERDTKTLFGSLQTLVASIMPGSSKREGEQYVPRNESLSSGLDHKNPN